ncbi:glutamyl-tRNA synthetase [Geosmithia morbida]|uniref:glutamate--tRNA ligase n=1 Tax=Geosmithia morbida TaxID=1094350 RepID=A0A9P4YQ35_9HYPO|nr:glutamyl-tRNA synthetase [Geosmithia morbida]KAF4119737.1 glutamyl-tRNA synthetase [Geosmithia morbida]
MTSLSRGIQISRALRCPQCHGRAWLFPQRRLFSLSPSTLNSSSSSSNTTTISGRDEHTPAKVTSSSLRDRLRSSTSGRGTARSKGGFSAGGVRRILGQTPDKPIRTRFAPSPTGYLHLGSLRTALFNNLASVASKGGSFILRIEDTDQSRLVHDAEDRIISDLKWLGLEWSEGPDCGGPHGPYRQSERLEIYKHHVDHLVDEGHAYRCFCKPEDLEKQKLELHNAGKPTFYPGTCRSIQADESTSRAAAGESHVVRFRGDAFGLLGHKDAIYGPFQKKEVEEDFIILKTDGFPTYHLANVVDDHLMEITHVEWLISTPKHLALYRAFGWNPPTFAHLGLLVNQDGSKLSKRNESANVSRYQVERYSPMAMQAWLANLGSSFMPGHDSPPRTIKDVADALSFKFTRGGIKLNPEKLDLFDVRYHRSTILSPREDLAPVERRLISSSLLEPILSEVHSLTAPPTSTFTSTFTDDDDNNNNNNTQNPFTDHSSEEWGRHTKTPVPALSIAYLENMLGRLVRSNRYKKRGDVRRLVVTHPHYFWRVPESIYALSLGMMDPQTRDGKLPAVLRAISRVCQDASLWEVEEVDGGADRAGQDAAAVVARSMVEWLAREAPVVSEMDVYALQRFVATGRPAALSHSAGDLFAVLGRDEWLYRLGVVRDRLTGAA